MARRTKLQYKPQYMPSASDVITKDMHTGEILNIESAIKSTDLYKLLYSQKSRRRREWMLIGGWVSQ